MNTQGFERLKRTQRIITTPHVSRFIAFPLSETDILYLQHIFILNGIHLITVENKETGRTIIKQMLDSLQWYYNCAVLTDTSISSHTITTLASYFDDTVTEEKMVDFFATQFYFDFLFIEATESLLAKPWITLFETTMLNFHIDYMTPIIVLHYVE